MKKRIKIELIPTQDLKNKMIVMYPSNMNLDELPLTGQDLAYAIINPPEYKELK